MREQRERVAPASLPSPGFSYAHSLTYMKPDKGKVTRAWRVTEAAPLVWFSLAQPYLLLFHEENETHLSMWSALLLQELSACLSEFILAKPSVIRRYSCWSPIPCCLQQNYRKSTDHIFPSLPSYYPSPLLSVSLQGRLTSQPPFYLFLERG